jgi:hypothetical protein
MTGRTTLKEARDALEAAKAGEPVPVSAPPVADELDALTRKLAEGADAKPAADGPPHGPESSLAGERR